MTRSVWSPASNLGILGSLWVCRTRLGAVESRPERGSVDRALTLALLWHVIQDPPAQREAQRSLSLTTPQRILCRAQIAGLRRVLPDPASKATGFASSECTTIPLDANERIEDALPPSRLGGKIAMCNAAATADIVTKRTGREIFSSTADAKPNVVQSRLLSLEILAPCQALSTVCL